MKFGGDTTGLQKALSKVNSATSSLSRELRGINSLLKLDPSNTELLSQKQIVLNQEINKTEEKLKTLKTAQEEANKTLANGGEISQENYRALQREIINTENKLKQLKLEASNWTTAGQKIEVFGEKITNVSSKVSNLGSKLSKTLTTSVFGLGVASAKTAIDFETAFTGVEKTVDGTKEQMAELKEGIKQMSKELPSTTTEISAVAEAAGQLGIQTDNVLSFTKTMIDMGNSTNLSADEAATTLARFANVTRMSQSDFNKLGSVIVELGNNFATTEAEIADMGMNLASAGTQVGMTQSEIMALATALSSVGLEAQAGGTAFSKVMINMQLAVETGSDELKDFAKVAGMTTKEFSKAFKEDATNAIMKFIEGLSKSGEQGESAIKILDDMEITETRLRDSLLRSANASDIFSKAINLGNKAWDENNALTNEANKKYSTTVSKMTITINKVKDLATNLGNKLLPSINNILDKSDKWLKKLDELDDAQIENIIQIGLMVAAAGPLIKVIGTIGTTAGTVTKGIGTLSQAIGVLKTGAESSNVSVNNLAKVLGVITSPAGLAVLGITAVTSALWMLGQKSDESVIKMEKQIDVLEEQTKTLNGLKESQEEYLKTNLSEIENVQKLKKELETLVDENGRVKEGYEGRVKFILSELNEALGTEYDLTGDIINQYKDLTNSIDEVIAKKKASIILNSMEESYTNALKNRSDAIKNLAELEKTYSSNKQKIIEKENEKLELQKKKQDIFTLSRINKLNEEIKTLQENVNAHDEQKNKIIEYNTTIDEYETASAIIKEGNLEKIEELNNRYTNSYQARKDETIASLAEQIQLESINLETQKETYNKTQSEITKNQLEESQNRLDALVQELIDATSTVNDLSPEQVTAWTNLAKGSYDKYSEELSQMEPTMQQKIQNMTGIIAGGTPQMQEKAEELGRKTAEEFDKSAEAKEKALNTIEGYLKGLTDDKKRQLLEQAGIEDINIVIDELNRGDLSEENGKNILQGLWNGLKNNTWRGKILGVASGLAQAVNKAFTGKDGWDEHSPSKKMKKFAEYYVQPISDVMKSKQKNIVSTAKNLANKLNSTFNTQMDLSQELDYEKMQSSLNKKIINGTSTIFTTPQIVFNVQELDEAKLQQCFNYINRKFGSKY